MIVRVQIRGNTAFVYPDESKMLIAVVAADIMQRRMGAAKEQRFHAEMVKGLLEIGEVAR